MKTTTTRRNGTAKTVDAWRNEMHEILAEIRQLELKAMLLGGDYTGPEHYVPGRRGLWGREITPDRVVKPSGPTVNDMIAFRRDAARWIVREINILNGIYESH